MNRALGIRGPLYAASDLLEDRKLGFATVSTTDIALRGTPEPGGLTTREAQHLLRGLRGLPIIGAGVVEVAPAYDHAELTTIAAPAWPTSW